MKNDTIMMWTGPLPPELARREDEHQEQAARASEPMIWTGPLPPMRVRHLAAAIVRSAPCPSVPH